MQALATITSKRQLTIPVDIFVKMGLFEGTRVALFVEDNILKLQSLKTLLNDLQGCVKDTKPAQDLDEMIFKSKSKHFKDKWKNKLPL